MILMPSASRAEVVERIVAVVGDRIVLLTELEDATEDFRQMLSLQLAGRMSEEERDRLVNGQLESRIPLILERLIREELIYQAAAERGIRVTDEEIDEQSRIVADSQGITMEELRRRIESEGLSWQAYNEEVRKQILRVKIEQRIIAPRLDVTESDLLAFYNQHYASEGPERAHLRLIFLPAAGDDPSARRQVRRKLEGLRKQIGSGASFAELARDHTQGPNAAQGGDIGFLAKGQMIPAVEEAAFSLEPGSVSDVIEGPQGFFLIQVVDRQGGEAPPFDEVRQEIQNRIFAERREQAFNAWVEDLLDETNVERRL